jgi:transcriptional regulator with XRE-family HTH domain
MTRRRRHRIASSLLSSSVLSYVLAQGQKQADVARMLGVTEGYISLVKSRERAFTLDHIEALAIGLDMPLGELLIQATDRPKASKKERGMLDRTARIMRMGDQMSAAIRRQAVKK